MSFKYRNFKINVSDEQHTGIVITQDNDGCVCFELNLTKQEWEELKEATESMAEDDDRS